MMSEAHRCVGLLSIQIPWPCVEVSHNKANNVSIVLAMCDAMGVSDLWCALPCPCKLHISTTERVLSRKLVVS
jgi:hypothetical protein